MWNFSFPQFSDSLLQLQSEMTSFRFTTLFWGEREGDVICFFPGGKKESSCSCYFPTAKKKKTQNNRDPFPSKNQPATTLPCLRGSTRSISTTTERLPNPVTLRFRPHKASQGVKSTTLGGWRFFFWLAPTSRLLRGGSLAKFMKLKLKCREKDDFFNKSLKQGAILSFFQENHLQQKKSEIEFQSKSLSLSLLDFFCWVDDFCFGF